MIFTDKVAFCAARIAAPKDKICEEHCDNPK